jgi:hypothetical protein
MSSHNLKPYIPLSCEEISLIESLDHWTNLQVRIFGLIRQRILDKSLVILQSLGEEVEANVEVDFSLITDQSAKLQEGFVVQILGELQVSL